MLVCIVFICEKHFVFFAETHNIRSVQCHFGVIRCTYLDMAYTTKMAVCRAKLNEMYNPRVVVLCNSKKADGRMERVKFWIRNRYDSRIYREYH